MTGRGRGNIKNRISRDFNESEKLTIMTAQMLSLTGPRGSFTDAVENKDEKLDESNENNGTLSSPSIISYRDSSVENLPVYKQINAIDFSLAENKNIDKVNEILDPFLSQYETDEESRQGFKVIFQEAVHNAEFATKLINMMKAVPYAWPKLLIEKLYTGWLQTMFEDCINLQSKNPIAIRNIARMHSEFFPRWANPSHIIITETIAKPLLLYWEMLLESRQEEDVKLFTTQLYAKGSLINTVLPEKLNGLLLQVRNLLANDSRLTASSKVWLLLALDVAWCRFGILPNDLQRFYVSLLGDEAMTHFQPVQNELTVNIQKNTVLDKITSDVNVLTADNRQPSNRTGNMSKMGGGDSFASSVTDSNSANNSLNQPPSPEFNPVYPKHGYENHDGPKPSFRREKYLVKAQTYKKISPNDTGMENIGVWNADANVKKTGANTPRPILGAGWRRKNSKPNETDANWRERDSADGSGDWRENPKSKLNPAAAGWEHKPKSTVGSGWDANSSANKESNKKSWSQHDDRTENDYTTD